MAAGPDWEGPAAGRRETGQTVGLRFGNKEAEAVGALGMGLAVAPGTVGACGAADRGLLLVCVGQKSAVGEAALGKVSGHPVVLLGAESRGFAAGLGEELDQAVHNTVSGPESHILLVPAVHKIPSVDHTACHPCLQECVLAFPLGIAGESEGHIPGQGNRAPAADLWEALAAIADRKDCLLHMVDLSFLPLGPWDQVAGF